MNSVVACITGPTGVGKTDTGWALLDLGAPMVLLDCDWFAARAPFSWAVAQDVKSVFEAVGAMVQFHSNRGLARFVIPMTIEMAASFSRARSIFESRERLVLTFRLRCELGTLRRRIERRDRSTTQRNFELAGLELQVAEAERVTPEFKVIDNTRLTEAATAKLIWKAIKEAEFSNVA